MDKEISSALLRILPFIVVIAIIAVRLSVKHLSPQDIALQKPVSTKRFLCWILGFLAYVLLIECTLNHFGILEIDKWNHPLVSSIIRITGAVILAPIAEELIFRGIFLNALEKLKLNKHLSIILQAVLFVLLHNFAYQNTLSSNIGVVQSFADACLFAYARCHTKSIYTPIVMHMTGNLIATLERFIV